MTDPTPAEALKAGDALREIDRITRLPGFDLGTLAWHLGEIQEITEAALAALPSPATDAGEVRTAPSDDWQPIETAPKDGTEFLAAWEDVERGRYVYGVIAWIDPRSDGLDWHEGDSIVGPPKYWRPLPAPPAAAIRGLAR